MSAPASTKQGLRRPLVLSGFMATGKSTVGRIVAARMGVPFVDTDEALVAQSGKSIGELFATIGEARFRENETQLVLPMLDDPTPRVIGFGGGTVTVPRVRHKALERATVVLLTATAETIVTRVASLAERPNLLAASPLDRARDLLALRRDVYAESHGAVSTEGRTPEEIADRVLAIAELDTLAMPLGHRSYVVELADGAPERLTAALEELAPSSVFVVTDDNVNAARGAWLQRALSAMKAPHHVVSITPGEQSKTLTTVSRLWDEMLSRGLDRDAVVLAFGGGVVGDLAGFTASTTLRGIRCVQIPTSLLAMVDSSVGGKTGFDHAAGKNMIGAFFQPSRVLVDLEHLTTLPPRERAAGLAEVVKIALVQDASLLELLEHTADSVRAGDRDALRPVIRAAIEAKIRVVRDDERESGARALLNLGHTVGHALEAHAGYARLLHGEAVAIGTVIELAATERLGLTPAGTSARAKALFERLALPTEATRTELTGAWPFVLSDKKRAATTLKLPVVTSIGAGAVEPLAITALRDAVLA
ncbi:MAG: 3-dehydroquinate synthase [Myxococcaceae bacterium]|jgi:shikimate kinase/3-dehydroquinate synthase|nr:3-dehydroquinate synthase [Myxococcaceae bacterium]